MSNEPLDAKEAAAQFHSRFQKEKEDIHNHITGITKTDTDNEQLDALFDAIHRRINELNKSVTNAMIYLPAYDQRQYQQQTKSLFETLAIQRTTFLPKSKFSFKSKRTKPPSFTQPLKTSEPMYTPEDTIPDFSQTTFTFSGQRDSYLSISRFISEGKEKMMNDCVISDLENCIVNLVRSDVNISSVHVNRLKNCLVITGPISGSILLRKCTGCVLILACHQFRMHDSSDVDVYLHATSRPIIEDSNHIRFGPYDTLICPEIQSGCQVARLDSENNQYASVEDFNWLKQHASPNWSVLSEKDRVPLNWTKVMELEKENGQMDENVLEALLHRKKTLE